jgi:predicted FMN-binding regulatory protein PaiB
LRYLTKAFCANFTAKALSDFIHNNEFWRLVDMGEEIPIAGFLPYSIVEISKEEIEELDKMSDYFDVPDEFYQNIMH